MPNLQVRFLHLFVPGGVIYIVPSSIEMYYKKNHPLNNAHILIYFDQGDFYGLYHGKSLSFTTIWKNMFSFCQASQANPSIIYDINNQQIHGTNGIFIPLNLDILYIGPTPHPGCQSPPRLLHFIMGNPYKPFFNPLFLGGE